MGKKRTKQADQDLRAQAESMAASEPSSKVAVEPHEDKDRLVHELRVHEIELQIQNEELRRAQLELEESRDKYRELYDFAPIGYLTLNADGLITQANMKMAELANKPRRELTNSLFSNLVHKEDRPIYYEHLRATLVSPIQQTCELRLWPAGGDPVYVQVSSLAEQSSAGTPALLFAIADISARRQAENDLRNANSLLEQRVIERTAQLETLNIDLRRRAGELQRLTHELSEAEDKERRRISEYLHEDLQQQLATALFHLSSLRGMSDAERARKQIGVIEDLVRSSIHQTRNLSKDLNPSFLMHTNLANALLDIQEQKQLKYGLIVKYEVELGMDTNSSAIKILLYKAVKELLFNAVKHAGVKEARVRALRAAGRIEITVSDEGVGFDPEILQANEEGSGIGLFCISERLKSVGGELRIKSAPGKGSTFVLIAPDR